MEPNEARDHQISIGPDPLEHEIRRVFLVAWDYRFDIIFGDHHIALIAIFDRFPSNLAHTFLLIRNWSNPFDKRMWNSLSLFEWCRLWGGDPLQQILFKSAKR